MLCLALGSVTRNEIRLSFHIASSYIPVMMRIRITSLRKTRLLPILGILCSILLLTGETLSCCRINESISDYLHAFLTGSTQSKPAQSDESDHHPNCHGHEGNTVAIPNGEGGSGAHYAMAGTCISEYSLKAKPMLAGDFAFDAEFIAGPALPLTFGTVMPFVPERPRPQNRSSPPLYLTTLRLLV